MSEHDLEYEMQEAKMGMFRAITLTAYELTDLIKMTKEQMIREKMKEELAEKLEKTREEMMKDNFVPNQ